MVHPPRRRPDASIYGRLTPEEIEAGLTNTLEDYRYYYANREDYTPTPAQFQRGLSDSSVEVRLSFIQRRDFKPTQEQINRGLQDPLHSIRHHFLASKAVLNAAQIDSILNDPSRLNRQMIADFNAAQCTAAQIEKGLTDPFWCVRQSFIKNAPQLNEMQIERVFLEETILKNVAILIRRPDVKISPAQIESALLLPSGAVKSALFETQSLTTQQINNLFCKNSVDELLLQRIMRRKNFLPTLEQLDFGLSHSNEQIRNFFEDHGAAWRSLIEKEQLRTRFDSGPLLQKKKTL